MSILLVVKNAIFLDWDVLLPYLDPDDLITVLLAALRAVQTLPPRFPHRCENLGLGKDLGSRNVLSNKHEFQRDFENCEHPIAYKRTCGILKLMHGRASGNPAVNVPLRRDDLRLHYSTNDHLAIQEVSEFSAPLHPPET